MAEAVAFKNGKYEVEDIDVKETNRNFTLGKQFVKPLPLMRADPVTCPDAFFPCNQFGWYILVVFNKCFLYGEGLFIFLINWA